MLRKCCFPVVVALLVLTGSRDCVGQRGPAFQYRFGRTSIPAATSTEPFLKHHSPQLARTHLETGVGMWANRQQCVSCHTHGIYMLVRPRLSKFWGAPNEATRDFVVSRAKKLQAGEDRSASFPVQMAYIARGLAAWDAQLRDHTSPETDAALRFVFQLQADDGSIRVNPRWPPVNSTTYYGTAMLAMGVADAPQWLATVRDPDLLEKIEKLKHYLRNTPPKNDHERLLLLWAATYSSDLLPAERQRKLVDAIWRQQLEDGGWSLWTFATPESLGGGKKAKSILAEPEYTTPRSDGYQTGLTVVVLRDAGVPAENERIRRAVSWLQANQRQSGRWWTRSLNTQSRFHFISYSGTAYAALALARCDALTEQALPPTR